jgi:hypothetical protein
VIAEVDLQVRRLLVLLEAELATGAPSICG